MRVFRLIAVTALVGLPMLEAVRADCICLNRGVEVVEGKTACIKTAKGPQLALCEKNLNVTNWKFLGEDCPTALNEAPEEQEMALSE